MEEIYFNKQSFEVPSVICQDFSVLLDIISPDTWNNILNDEDRQKLMNFLPDFPEEDLNEKTQTLEMFFMNENFNFGSPLSKFFHDFKNGHFNKNIATYRKINKKIQRKVYRCKQREYFNDLLEVIFDKRKDLQNNVYFSGFLPNSAVIKRSLPKQRKKDPCSLIACKRYFRELKAVKAETGFTCELSEDENYPDGVEFNLNKKQRRQLLQSESTLPHSLNLVMGTHTRGSMALDLESRLTSSDNPFDISDVHFKNLLSHHENNQKRKIRRLSSDTSGVTLQEVFDRVQIYCKKSLSKPMMVTSPLNAYHQFVKKKQRNKLTYQFSTAVPEALEKEVPQSGVLLPSPLVTNYFNRNASSEETSSDESSPSSVERIIKKEVVTDSLESTPTLAPELTQETHMSFFSLLRDVICSTLSQRMNELQLSASISAWQDSAISPLNEWFCFCESWVKVLPSAINFLCGYANLSSEKSLVDYVPFLEHKTSINCFQWIGAGRDSDFKLESLAQIWLDNRDCYSNKWPKPEHIISVENKKSKLKASDDSGTSSMSCLSSTEKNSLENNDNSYHTQEALRYRNPHKAFTYSLNGFDYVIGPVKGIYTDQISSSSRPRDHTLLVSSRPHFVTILSLVWDAVSRLPHGEGTKNDICKLLKESQFIVTISTPGMESTLTSVVSGALDRLQNEKDPCVKFETSRKLWIYLHCNRTEQEFERIHHLNGPSRNARSKNLTCRTKKSKKEEPPKGPPNVAMEKYSSAIKQMDGSQIKVKDEDLLKNWVKISTAKIKKRETVKITSTQLKADLAKMKAKAADNSEQVNKTATKIISRDQLDKITDSPNEALLPAVQSTFQFSKKGKTVIESTTSTPTSSISTQGSRMYQTVLEKKKFIKTNTTECATTSPIVTSEAQLAGIKVLQYSNSNLQGKNVLSGASLMMDGNSTVPATLLGQKLVMAGNRVLLHSGKILHNLTGRIVPTQNLATFNNIYKTEIDSSGGNFFQFASVDGKNSKNVSGSATSLQKVNILSHKGLTVTPPKERQSLAKGELKLKLGLSGNITGNLISLGGKQLLLTKGHHAKRTTEQQADNDVICIDNENSEQKKKPNFISTNVTTSKVLTMSSINAEQQPIKITAKTTSSSIPATTFTGSTSGLQQMVVPSTCNQFIVSTNASGQQIMMPAIQSSQLNFKQLQSFQSFKVVSASQVSQTKGKPMVAHILPPSSSQKSNMTKVAFQIAPEVSQKKKS